MRNVTPLFPLDSFQIEGNVGNLLARARAMLMKSSDESLAAYGITHAQGAILLMISAEEYSTVADLARKTRTDAASTKRMIDRLDARELIRRVPCSQDRRLIRLYLTDRGTELANLVPKVYCRVLRQHFCDFTEEEIGYLKSLLLRLLVSNASCCDYN